MHTTLGRSSKTVAAAFLAVVIGHGTVPSVAEAGKRPAVKASAPFTARPGDRIRVVLDNYGPGVARVHIAVFVTDVDPGEKGSGAPFRLLASSGQVDVQARADSFFDVFVDLGECRYRVVVTMDDRKGKEPALTASVEVRGPSGNVDSFFDVFFEVE